MDLTEAMMEGVLAAGFLEIQPPGVEHGPLCAGPAAAATAVAAEVEAAAAVQHPAAAASGPPAVELSLGAPADAQATHLPQPASLVAAPSLPRGNGDALGPSAPSRQESALQPQCAILTGAALDQEVSTAQLAPLPPRELSQQYQTVAAGLRAALIPPEATGVSWDHFPNFLGDGTRARLQSLATLHLGPPAAAEAAAFPAAVKELPANSNRVLLGAAINCELYQERVIRWARAQGLAAGLGRLAGCGAWGRRVALRPASPGCLYGVAPALPGALPGLPHMPQRSQLPRATLTSRRERQQLGAQLLTGFKCPRLQGTGTEGGRAAAGC